MYTSPIEMVFSDLVSDAVKKADEYIVACVQQVGVKVDKDELVKALEFDRGQYEKGYRDGYAEALTDNAEPVKHGEWRYDEALELEWCSECGFGKRKGDKRWYSYCPNCGAQMEEKDGAERK